MSRCEDYPCCGHGPPPMGDGGGCPDSDGRYDCVLCGAKLPVGASSSICGACLSGANPCHVCGQPRLECWCEVTS